MDNQYPDDFQKTLREPQTVNTSPLEKPFYYLENFHQVLEWIAQRYDDLLDEQERQFIVDFAGLPKTAQGLLVRMVMRKGTLFRASKLSYPELGAVWDAVMPLLENGWVDQFPAISLEALFGLLRKSELTACFQAHAIKRDRKSVV